MGIAFATLTSCVSQFEHMSKGAGQSSYTYHYGQVGGQGTAQSSMGTSVAFDGQKSLADLIQGWVTRGASLDFLKGKVNDNALSQYKEGQITQRQLAKLQQEVDLAKTNGEISIAAKQLERQ